MRSKHVAGFAVLGLLWGSEWIAAGTLAVQVPPLLGMAARFALAAATLLPWTFKSCTLKFWTRQGRQELRAERFPGMRASLILSLTLIGLPQILLLWSSAQISSATIAVLCAATPMAVVLFSSLLPSVATSAPRSAWQPALLGFGGVALAIWSARSLPFVAGAAVLLAVGCIAASTVYAKRELKAINPAFSAGLQCAGASILLALASFSRERGERADWNASAILALIYLGVFATAAGFSLYFWLLKELEAYQVAAIVWVEPLLGTIEAAILFRQPLSLTLIVGLIVALGSLVVLMRPPVGEDAFLSIGGRDNRN
jgi:drug/metabolite transporter (DMT)-like permease